MLQQIEAYIVFEGVIIRWQTRSWRLKRMPVIGLTQELRSDCSKSFSNCRRLDSHFQYCRTQYWTQATSMQDADCSTTCTTKFEDLSLLRWRLPGWSQFIWMLRIIVLAETCIYATGFLILGCQNPLFINQSSWGVWIPRARLGICVCDTFYQYILWTLR